MLEIFGQIVRFRFALVVHMANVRKPSMLHK